MEQKAVIQQVRAEISKANITAALATLTSYLDKAGSEAVEAYNQAVQLAAQYEQTQRSEKFGMVSFEDAKVSYNQINNGILSILQDLEGSTGEADTAPVLKTKKSKQWLMWALPSGALLLAALAYFLWPVAENETCPNFDPDTAFDILVLPFKPILSGTEISPAHRLFEIGLNNLIDNNALSGKANVDSYGLSIAQSEDYPISTQDAIEISTGCNAQLIIWGITEKVGPGNQLILSTDYLFVDEDDIHLDRQEIGIDTELTSTTISLDFPRRGRQIDTLGNLSSITENIPGHLLSRLKFLLGVFAHESGDMAATQKILKDWPEEPLDAESTKIWGSILADSYQKSNNDEKAEQTYTQLLARDPDNTFARNNRAIIAYKNGNSASAISDLNAAIDKNKNDTIALIARSYIFMKEGLLKVAEEDLRKVKQLDPDRPVVKRWTEKLVERKKEEQRKKRAAAKAVAKNPRNVNALVEQATAELNLGNYTIARTLAEKVTRLDPKRAEAYSIIQEVDIMEKKDSKNMKKAQSNGVTRAKVIQARPLLDAMMKKE